MLGKLARRAVRAIWITVGLLCVGLGVVGIALPLLPTTPFMLLAAFAFAQSSERLHAWLLQHRVFGPIISNWRRHRAITRRTKIVSLAVMAGVPIISILAGVSQWVLAVQIGVLSCSALFVATRPAPPDSRGEKM
ncbi:MAG: YbaN family protein [Myxococcota bacterium]